MRLYTVYAADRSGNCWDEATLPAREALARVRTERLAYPDRAHGLWDPEDPERGDVEEELEEELEEEDYSGSGSGRAK